MSIDKKHFPEIRVYAGPNGSGKSTITLKEDIIGEYINADDIKREKNISDLEAAQEATKMREACVDEKKSFTFETVLSTDRNLNLLKNAKEQGFFIRCSFVLTADPSLNVLRVTSRVDAGGHPVPPDKIITRYHKSLAFIPEIMMICDRFNIYDNTADEPVRILKKRNDQVEIFPCENWPEESIKNLLFYGHR